MSFSEQIINDLQKAINDLKGFRPKEGILAEDGIIGPYTIAATAEFAEACKNGKLIEFFLNDPYNLVRISDIIIKTGIDGNRILKDAYLAFRRELQRIIWKVGAELYLGGKGYTISKEALINSLNDYPKNFSWGNYSDAAEVIRKLNGFRALIEKEIQNNEEFVKKHENFSGQIGVKFGDLGRDAEDLFYSIGKIDISYEAKYEGYDKWEFKCHGNDKYDFTDYRVLDDIFEQGLEKTLSAGMGAFANDFGILSQKDGVIKPFDISLEFTYTYWE